MLYRTIETTKIILVIALAFFSRSNESIVTTALSTRTTAGIQKKNRPPQKSVVPPANKIPNIKNTNRKKESSSNNKKKTNNNINTAGTLKTTLQSCFTPHQVLDRVARHVATTATAASTAETTDPDGSLSSLILVRLSKQLISQDNSQRFSQCWDNFNKINNNNNNNDDDDDRNVKKIDQKNNNGRIVAVVDKESSSSVIPFEDEDMKILSSVIDCLANTRIIADSNNQNSNVEALVEGTKACCVISRILQNRQKQQQQQQQQQQQPESSSSFSSWYRILMEGWDNRISALSAEEMSLLFQDHHLTGLKWAFDTFQMMEEQNSNTIVFPKPLQKAYDALNLPFCIHPGLLLKKNADNHSSLLPTQNVLSVPLLRQQVNFKVDEICATGKTSVTSTTTTTIQERRMTAWQGDKGVAGFAYSGKVMPRNDWSPLVLQTRDLLHATTGQYYDCCLLNLYHSGTSGMRYHIDPDQGTMWDYDTAVVSVGATRRFAFREIAKTERNQHRPQQPQSKPHTFVVMDGDVTHMFNDCQERFQHTVKKAENKDETAARSSLVFKRTFGYQRQIK